jgi:elongation factor 3
MVTIAIRSALNHIYEAYGFKPEEAEADYIEDIIKSLFAEFKKLQVSQRDYKSLLEESKEIVGPIIGEYLSSDSDVYNLLIDTIIRVFPEAKGAFYSDEFESSSVTEYPLLDFSDLTLAFMGLELLRHTSLKLYRGRVYGLIGKNGVGKTTLLNKLAGGDVPGFPQNCTTCMVKHELEGSDELMTPRELIRNNSILVDVGFLGPNEYLQDIPCSELSGGWRMRTSIGRALSKQKIDLLLLDEPTNHLDRDCVDWLVSFLNKLDDVAVVIVSHDEEFLNRVIDFVIYFYNHKLRLVQSNLTDFVISEGLDPVTLVPNSLPSDALTHAHSALGIVLPKPGSLDGVKSRTQTIAKLDDVCFVYPPSGSKERRAGVWNISGRICLGSRIALEGPNGAGKSTIVSLLVGSLSPDSGAVFRHPNMRIAFMSQHHVHHLESCLDKTCLDYFVERFGSGTDKEVMKLESISESSFEQLDRVAKGKKFAPKCGGRSANGGVECLLGRRKEGKEYSYEVQWMNWRSDQTDWIPRSVLETELGVSKLCSALDTIIAQKKAGVDQRKLDFNSIKKYLESFGILAHTAEGKIAGLSGGQKSRLTLAAAMWTFPHMLVLDEPTNYLDSASLDTLQDAIANYGGAVVVISHNRQFVERFASEKWLVENGRITSVVHLEKSSPQIED